MTSGEASDCVLRSEGGEIICVIEGYERESALSDSDANWLSVDATVRKDNFKGNANISLTTYDLARLAEELRLLLSGSVAQACLDTDEQALSITIALRQTGTGEVVGTLRDPLNPGVSVTAKFGVDRANIEEFLSAVDATLQRFPVRAQQGREPGNAP